MSKSAPDALSESEISELREQIQDLKRRTEELDEAQAKFQEKSRAGAERQRRAMKGLLQAIMLLKERQAEDGPCFCRGSNLDRCWRQPRCTEVRKTVGLAIAELPDE